MSRSDLLQLNSIPLEIPEIRDCASAQAGNELTLFVVSDSHRPLQELERRISKADRPVRIVRVGTIPVTDQGEVDIRLLSEVPSWTDRERSIALEQLQRWGNVAIESRSDEGIFIQNDPVDPSIGPAQAPSTDEPNASDAPNPISSNEPLSIVTGPPLDTGKAPATLFEALKEVA